MKENIWSDQGMSSKLGVCMYKGGDHVFTCVRKCVCMICVCVGRMNKVKEWRQLGRDEDGEGCLELGHGVPWLPCS